MTDKQFNDAFTAAGGWFLLSQFETIADWIGSKAALIDHLYTKGFDAKPSGTSARVSSVLRLIDEKRVEDAIVKCRDSKNINRVHPEARQMAEDILKRRF